MIDQVYGNPKVLAGIFVFYALAPVLLPALWWLLTTSPRGFLKADLTREYETLDAENAAKRFCTILEGRGFEIWDESPVVYARHEPLMARLAERVSRFGGLPVSIRVSFTRAGIGTRAQVTVRCRTFIIRDTGESAFLECLGKSVMAEVVGEDVLWEVPAEEPLPYGATAVAWYAGRSVTIPLLLLIPGHTFASLCMLMTAIVCGAAYLALGLMAMHENPGDRRVLVEARKHMNLIGKVLLITAAVFVVVHGRDLWMEIQSPPEGSNGTETG